MITKEETGRRPEGLEFEKTSRHWRPSTWRLHIKLYPQNSISKLVRNDFVVRFFFHGPLVGYLVIRRVNKAEPVFIILTHEVTSVVETRVSGFFTELDVKKPGYLDSSRNWM